MPDLLADLNDFAADLEASDLLPDPAWSRSSVWGVIDIDGSGQYVSSEVFTPSKRFKDLLPTLPNRTRAPVPAFLSGSHEYWAGRHHRLNRDYHHRVLDEVEDAAARAVLAFVDATAGPPIAPSPGYAIRIDGVYAHKIPALVEAWGRFFEPEENLNPTIDLLPWESFLRLGTRSNANSVESYSNDQGAISRQHPDRAAAALNWLLKRPSTYRHQDTVVTAWVEGDPFFDPTPYIFPITPEDGEETQNDECAALPTSFTGDLCVAILRGYPPARMHVRWYWSGPAKDALGCIGDFYEDLRSGIIKQNHNGKGPVIRWPLAFYGKPRYAEMIVEILQSVICGDRLADGIAYEIVRQHRAPQPVNGPLCAALLQTWARGKGYAIPTMR